MSIKAVADEYVIQKGNITSHATAIPGQLNTAIVGAGLVYSSSSFEFWTNDWAAYGQGFAVGLEDAATIPTLFPSGIKTPEIPSRLKLLAEIGKPRAERVSKMSTDGKKRSVQCLMSSVSFWIKPELLGYIPVDVVKMALTKV
ncbi:hypothetical protein C8R45DRAFT_1113009 [Mycena sanguinolenta]|nr:hypothetical protein C8R45DRAFT_1113009 [Mycena sanguinolenta]